MTISHPAPPLDDVRLMAARDGTSLAVITGLTRWATCPVCWAIPSRPCRVPGTHMARYARARQLGLITEAQAGLVFHAAGVFTAETVVAL